MKEEKIGGPSLTHLIMFLIRREKRVFLIMSLKQKVKG